MTRSPGPAALRLLLRLKLRGLVRRQWRRLRTPRGLVLTIVGAATFGVWLTGMAFSFARAAPGLVPSEAELRVRAFACVLLVLSLSSALTQRGLYLPRAEVERLFSAPVSRANLVRYRLRAGGARALLGGILLGLFGARRMPEPVLAFAGILLAMQTLPVVSQGVALALGELEERSARALRAVGILALFVLVGGAGMLVYALATGRPAETLPWFGRWLGEFLERGGDPLAHPLIARLTLPFLPWGRMIAAGSTGEFALWCAACLALHFALVEACARVPIDFREASLATSARVAARRLRLVRGGGVAATRASRGSADWRVPWLFGRGPMGAIAWRKSVGMVRKAKGAFAVSLVALSFLTVFAHLALHGDAQRAVAMPFLLAGLGTVYLCSGLRFDFREDLERMDAVRAWPLSPALVFLGMLLPEVAGVSLLLGATVLIQSALAGEIPPHVLGLVLGLPVLVFDWVAVDNLVFLFAPVRAVPGQEGLVQNAGRRMVHVLLLLALVAPTLGAAVFAGWKLHTFLRESAGLSEAAAVLAGYALGFLILLASAWALVGLGGRALRHFDVARDRG